VSPVVNVLALFREALWDGWRRARYFGRFRAPSTVPQARAELQKDVHLLERALALPEPRRPFGNVPARRIEVILERYGESLGEDLRAHAALALEDRDRWNDSGARPSVSISGISSEAKALLGSRHSIRAFSSRRAPTREELEAIVGLAMRAPSVSNTQSWRVRAYAVAADIEAILTRQQGNVGSSPIPLLLLLSVDIRGFTGPEERNQMWIDGGIFLQQLLLSVQAHGWSSCPLNFSSTNSQARGVRKLAGIAEYEEIICFVALGEADTAIPPARSARKPLDDVLSFDTLPGLS
jgi:nitroreductase